jgi:ABC-type sugar transport system permease subunit
MAFGILGDSRPAYVRFLLMLIVEAFAGVCLYAVFTVTPVAVQVVVAVASWAIVVNENLTFPKNKSLGSILCGITGAASFSCFVAWRTTHEESWSRLGLVGGCLLAGLIFLDRRQEWFDR